MSKKNKNKGSLEQAMSQYLKPQERFVGWFDFEWPYTVISFNGDCSYPEKLNIFEETICKLLSINKDISLLQIGAFLGLDVEHDLAEKGILLNAIRKLKEEKMIDGDESIYWVTDLGEKNLKEGFKNATYTKSFKLYIDALGDVCENAKMIFESIEHLETPSFNRDHLPENIEDVKPIAESQAPEVHYPNKNYYLLSCTPLDPPTGFVALVRVIIFKNNDTNELRALVTERKGNKIINELSDALNKLDEKKLELYYKIIEIKKNVKI